MSNFIRGKDIQAVVQGIQVSRATAALPATAAQNIFSVTGGRVFLMALLGEVTTIIQAQACTVKFTSTPTTGSAIDLSAASASISALEVGGRITLPNPPAAATAAVTSNAGWTPLTNIEAVVPIGTISYTTSATNTGSIKWDLFYVPIDVGAAVVAL
jgi:hypothetical protein